MKTSDIQRINCGDPPWWAPWHWPQLVVKRGSEKERNVIERPLVWDSQRKKEKGNLNSQGCMTSSKQGKILNQGIIRKSYLFVTPWSKRSTQGSYSGTYKNIQSGFWTYRSKHTKFIFFILLHLMDSYSINVVFTSTALFQSFKCQNIILLMPILRGA